MVRGGCSGTKPFRKQLEQWKFVGGGTDINGNILEEPWQLTRARFIDSLCQRYSCLPSQLLQEDIDLIVRMHNILALAGEHESQPQTPSMEESLANMSKGM